MVLFFTNCAPSEADEIAASFPWLKHFYLIALFAIMFCTAATIVGDYLGMFSAGGPFVYVFLVLELSVLVIAAYCYTRKQLSRQCKQIRKHGHE